MPLCCPFCKAINDYSEFHAEAKEESPMHIVVAHEKSRHVNTGTHIATTIYSNECIIGTFGTKPHVNMLIID